MRPIPRFARYTALVFALSVPFWIGGYAVHGLMPRFIPIALPFSALMTFVPAAAALILTWASDGAGAATALLARAFDVGRIRGRGWTIAAVLFMPMVLAISFGLMTIAGFQMPDAAVPLAMAPVMFAMFFLGAAGEEIGWQGFAYEALEREFCVLESALILGAVWAVWHIVPFFQAGHDWEWVAWQCIVTLFLRVVTVWLYAYGGRSVFLAILFHTMSNVSMFLFPNYGSYYDPATAAVVLAGATAFMAAVWGPGMIKEQA